MPDYDLIVVGELHGFEISTELIKSLISKNKSKFILHEMMEDYEVDPEQAKSCLTGRFWISNVFDFGGVKHLLEISSGMGVRIIGSDMHDHGIEDIEDYHVLDRDLTEEEIEEENGLIALRGKKQAGTILEYVQKSQKPVIAITGAYHLRRESELMKRLIATDRKILIYFPACDGKMFYGQHPFSMEDLKYLSRDISDLDY